MPPTPAAPAVRSKKLDQEQAKRTQISSPVLGAHSGSIPLRRRHNRRHLINKLLRPIPHPAPATQAHHRCWPRHLLHRSRKLRSLHLIQTLNSQFNSPLQIIVEVGRELPPPQRGRGAELCSQLCPRCLHILLIFAHVFNMRNIAHVAHMGKYQKYMPASRAEL